MRRSGLFLGTFAIAIVAAISLVSAPACTVAGTCAYTAKSYCTTPSDFPCEGQMVDTHTWESTSPNGTWLDYPGERGYYLELRDSQTGQVLDGTVYEVIVYISTSAHPGTDGTQFTIAGGNLSVIKILGKQVYVQNDTCADYFMRAVVHFQPTADASVDSSTDASVDSSKD